MIENIRKYGVLVCVRCHDWGQQDLLYGGILYLSVPCHLFVAYLIELVAAQRAHSAVGRRKKGHARGSSREELKLELRRGFQSSWRLIATAHAINATLNLLIASWVVYNKIHHPLIGTACELHALIVWLKTCSYAFTNRDLRRAYLSLSPTNELPDLYKLCPYPQNISLGNLSYFWWAPTLVYQPVYPRTESIRWLFVAKRLAEGMMFSVAIWIASAQYAAPLLQNSLDKMATLDVISILERLLKLSTISLFCWLCGFFAFFQSFMNALAEVMRFGDREFYSDWWNAPSIRKYWTSWNKPVMAFMRRHIYAPLVRRGWNPIASQIIVFVFSGLLHELLVGIPTHNIICKSSSAIRCSEQVRLTHGRDRILRHGGPDPTHSLHRSAAEPELAQWARAGQHDLLAHLLHPRAAARRAHVLLRVAGKVRQHEQAAGVGQD